MIDLHDEPAAWLEGKHKQLEDENLGAAPFDADFKLALVAALCKLADKVDDISTALTGFEVTLKTAEDTELTNIARALENLAGIARNRL
jgi:hypothetical protein